MDARWVGSSGLVFLLAVALGCSPAGSRTDGATPAHDGSVPADTGASPDGGPTPDASCATPPCHDAPSTPPGADSDLDGLSDAEEASLGTDPTNLDTDGDGVTDLGEVRGTGTDPLDPASTVDPGDFFVVLPYEGDHARRTLRFGTALQMADVFFLVDTSGSMQPAVDDVSSSLRDLATRIAAAVPNVEFGVGIFEDFPISPYGNRARAFFVGPSDDDVPYQLRVAITSSLDAVQGALALTIDGFSGGDGPESQVAALYLAATGAALSYEGGSVGAAGCAAGRTGSPCFRPGALPIVVLVSDAPFHNGPGGANAYSGIPTAPTFDAAMDALRAIGARVIGVDVGSASAHMNAVATATGSVDGAGAPLVYSGAASGTSERILDGIEALTTGTPQDVTTATENGTANPDGFDARTFIKAIVPLEGYVGASPGGYDHKDAATFYGVVPGTEVEFDVDFYNDVRGPGPQAEIFTAFIVVLGNGVARLDVRTVYVIVPPSGGTVLI